MTGPNQINKAAEKARTDTVEEPKNESQREIVFEKKQAIKKGQNTNDRGRRRPSELSNAFAQGVPLTQEERQLPRMPQPGPKIEQSPYRASQSSYESEMPEIRVPKLRRRPPPIYTGDPGSMKQRSPPSPKTASQDWIVIDKSLPRADSASRDWVTASTESVLIPRRKSTRRKSHETSPEDELIQSKLSSKPTMQRGKEKEDIEYPEATNFFKPMTPISQEAHSKPATISPSLPSKDSSPDDIFPFAQQTAHGQKKEKSDASIISKELLKTSDRLESLMFAEKSDGKKKNQQTRGRTKERVNRD